ncbi:MAG: D-glycero-beta-D-manno-heptose-7-phosphate kinase [Fusobacteria bacterium]|nr:MAG: D-glycero-beta-D-manno-heptose-7-phosphate kinase [Fusobacteriota bacterium]
MVAKTRVMEILDKFKDITIAVIGDLMLDDYIIGEVTRISPEAPVPVVNVKEERFVLGGGANVLNNLSTLSCKTYSFGVIGNDNNGTRLINELKKENIDTKSLVIAEDRPTIVKRRILAQHQQLLRLDWEDKKDITSYHEELIIENLKFHLKEIDAIILSDYDKGVLTPTLAKKVIELARENNIIVTVDPKPSNAINYVGATSMTPNRKEAMECMGLSRIDDTEKLGRDLKDKLNLDNLLLTRSEEGMSIFMEDEIINIPTFAKEVYDVTGAGDTVISVFTLAAAAGATWHEAAKIANVAAGVVVGRMGTSTVTKEEILEFYDKVYREWV